MGNSHSFTATTSKKRTFEGDDESTAFPEQDQAKRAKLTPVTDTTIVSLPIELQDRFLMEAVVAEVRDRRMVRSVWKQSADRVVERLRNACSQWNYTLTTDYFRKRLHETLDSLPPVQISLNVQHRHWFISCVAVATLNDKVFVLSHRLQQHPVINVYDRNDLQTAESTIQLKEVTNPCDLVACSATNCLYVLHKTPSSVEILQVTEDEDEFDVSPLITSSVQSVSIMSVSAEGRLILFQGPTPSTITAYNSDGSVEHRMDLKKSIYFLYNIVQKSNGNFILAGKTLVEIDKDGNAVREYDPPDGRVCCAVGEYDWIMTVDDGSHVRLLDSEFNPWNVTARLDRYDNCWHSHQVHYDRQRNEFVVFDSGSFHTPAGIPTQGLTVVTFTERSSPKDALVEED